MYKGDKLCSCCNKPGSESVRYSATDICVKCYDLYKLGYATKEQNDKKTDIYYNAFIAPTYTGDVSACSIAYAALIKTCKLLEEPQQKITEQYRIGHSESSRSERIVLEKNIAESIKDLHTAIFSAIKSSYIKGKSEGASLLISLNNGDLTLANFDEQTKIK